MPPPEGAASKEKEETVTKMRLPLGDTAARLLVFSSYGDTQVRDRSCISGNNFIRKSVFYPAKIVAVVAVGYFRRHDRSRACSLARRQILRQYETTPLDSFSRRRATLLGAVGYQDEVLSAGILRPTYVVSLFTGIRKNRTASAFQTTT